MRLLIDTNVYLEFFLKRENYDSVFGFFQYVARRNTQTCVSAMSLRDFGYIMHKYLHDNDLTKKLQLKVYEMTSKVINTSADAAIESLYSEAADYEDSLQTVAAEESMCDAIVTFNKKDFENSKLPVFTPNELIQIWNKCDWCPVIKKQAHLSACFYYSNLN